MTDPNSHQHHGHGTDAPAHGEHHHGSVSAHASADAHGTREGQHTGHQGHAMDHGQHSDHTGLDEHGGHGEHAQHGGHGDHSGHGGHGDHVGQFRRLFWINLVIAIPAVALSPMFAMLLGYEVPGWAGWVAAVLGTVMYVWGGRPFLTGAVSELKSRKPGMMLLIALAITVAFFASWAATLGLVRRPVTARQQAVPPRAPHREGPAPRTREPVARPPSPDRPAPESAAAAVQGLIAVGDLTDSPVMLAQVERSLRQSGVSMVTAEEGQPFDTEWHHGVGVLPAPRPDLNLTVARVVRPGWRSVDGLLRPVEVEVYRTDIP